MCGSNLDDAKTSCPLRCRGLLRGVVSAGAGSIFVTGGSRQNLPLKGSGPGDVRREVEVAAEAAQCPDRLGGFGCVGRSQQRQSRCSPPLLWFTPLALLPWILREHCRRTPHPGISPHRQACDQLSSIHPLPQKAPEGSDLSELAAKLLPTPPSQLHLSPEIATPVVDMPSNGCRPCPTWSTVLARQMVHRQATLSPRTGNSELANGNALGPKLSMLC